MLKQYLHLILSLYSRMLLKNLSSLEKERLSRLMTVGHYSQGHPVNGRIIKMSVHFIIIYHLGISIKLKAIINEKRSVMGGAAITIKVNKKNVDKDQNISFFFVSNRNLSILILIGFVHSHEQFQESKTI